MAEGLEWFGFFAPAKTPSAAIETLRSAIHSALARADVKEGMAKLSLDISTCTPNELVSMIIADTRRSAEIVKLSGFKIAE
jgi:tripartite-type tricarboxylate transporter receptor subunit TctC